MQCKIECISSTNYQSLFPGGWFWTWILVTKFLTTLICYLQVIVHLLLYHLLQQEGHTHAVKAKKVTTEQNKSEEVLKRKRRRSSIQDEEGNQDQRSGSHLHHGVHLLFAEPLGLVHFSQAVLQPPWSLVQSWNVLKKIKWQTVSSNELIVDEMPELWSIKQKNKTAVHSEAGNFPRESTDNVWQDGSTCYWPGCSQIISSSRCWPKWQQCWGHEDNVTHLWPYLHECFSYAILTWQKHWQIPGEAQSDIKSVKSKWDVLLVMGLISLWSTWWPD